MAVKKKTTYSHIYGLVDPRTDDIRYVGKTKYPVETRFKQHIKDARKGKVKPVFCWIRKLWRLKLEPYVICIGRVSDNFWEDAEKCCIKYLRESIGSALTNLAGGGGGLHDPCDATREKLRKAVLGTKQSAATKAKKSASLKNRYFSPEHRAKISAALKGKKLSETHRNNIWRNREHKPLTKSQKAALLAGVRRRWDDPKEHARMSKLATGRKMPREAVERVAAANKGRKRTPETIERLRLSHLGKKPSKESIRKRSETMKRLYAEGIIKSQKGTKRGPYKKRKSK